MNSKPSKWPRVKSVSSRSPLARSFAVRTTPTRARRKPPPAEKLLDPPPRHAGGQGTRMDHAGPDRDQLRPVRRRADPAYQHLAGTDLAARPLALRRLRRAPSRFT